MTKRRDIVKLLEENGFENKGGTNHDLFVKGKRTTVVPRHREIDENMFRKIKKQAGLR